MLDQVGKQKDELKDQIPSQVPHKWPECFYIRPENFISWNHRAEFAEHYTQSLILPVVEL